MGTNGMSLKEKIKKHLDTTYFHLTLKSKEDFIDEFFEFLYLLYKGIGFLLGIAVMTLPSLMLLWVILFGLWLMIDIRLTKKEKVKQ